MRKIAIIGAGFSGLVLANMLSSKADVTIYEKARGVGGRMSTRYADPYFFDHGAQCFTARTSEFKSFLAPFQEKGIVAEWNGQVVNLEINKPSTPRIWNEIHLVAAPHMNSLCKSLSENVNVVKSVEVRPITRNRDSWFLSDTDGNDLGDYDVVISTAPPAQTVALFHQYLPENAPLHHAEMHACHALMIGYDRHWDKSWIAAKVHNNPIKWISVNSSKPGRMDTATSLVCHTRSLWSNQHIDDEPTLSQQILYEEFMKLTDIPYTPDYLQLHRWRYAIVRETQNSGYFYNSDRNLAATGDWCKTSRLEEVYLSAHALGLRIMS